MAVRAIGVTLAACLVLCPSVLHSASPEIHQLDEMLPGFKPNLVYDSSGIENVNIFSGDPNLSVPLGPTYPLGVAATFQLSAHYSVKFWRVSAAVCYQDEADCFNDVYVTRAQVNGAPTLGLGWTLELGVVVPHVSPPGTTSVLWRTSDGGSHECAVGANDAVGDCPDLNVRIRKPGANEYRVTYPDGTTHVYGHRYLRPASPNEWDFVDQDRFESRLGTYRYGLTQIINPYGAAVLDVHYVNETNLETDPDRWRVDRIVLRRGEVGGCSQCPQITYHWRKDPSNTWDVLDYIQFPPSAATSGQGQVVSFVYSDQSPLLRRAMADSGTIPQCAGYTAPPELVPVPLLTRIDDSGISPYSFSYYPPEATNTIAAGAIESITLQTGGTISYAYEPASGGRCTYPDSGTCESPEALPSREEPRPIPNALEIFDPCTDGAMRSRFLDTSPAVGLRTEFDPFSGAAGSGLTSITSYWRRTYSSRESAGDLYPSDERVLRRVLVSRPTGNSPDSKTYTAYYFAAAPAGGAMPVELERRMWHEPEGASAPNRSYINCYATNSELYPDTCGALQAVGGGRIAVVNQTVMDPRRLTREVTWYGPNPISGGDCALDVSVACHQTAYSGVYDLTARAYPVATQSIDRTGNGPSIFLVTSDWLRRTTTTTFSPITSSSNWRPDLVSQRLVAEEYTTGCGNDHSERQPCSTLTRFEHALSNGFLLKVSTVDPADNSKYLQTRYVPDGSWNPATEEKSGAGIVSPTIFSKYRLFQNGLVTRTTVSGSSYASYDVDRDGVSGLVTASWDPMTSTRSSNDFATRYAYDLLGRLTMVTPPGGEVPTRYGYLDWSPNLPSRPPYVVVTGDGEDPTQLNGAPPEEGSGSVDAYQFDGFGRLRRQIRRLPNASPVTGSYFSFQESRYDVGGHLGFRSEWNPCSASSSPADMTSCFNSVAAVGTVWSDFDVLGRARQIVTPDEVVTTVSFDEPSANIPDSDTAEITTVGKGVGPTVVSAKRRDIFGRLLIVAEPAASSAIPQYVTYDFTVVPSNLSFFHYDVSGHLTRALVLPYAENGTVERSYKYNSLGFLETEFNPEHVDDANPSDSGTTTYGSYDALGNVLSKALNGHSYSYIYDMWGRLTHVAAGGSNLLRYYYDQLPEGSTRPNYGRLTTRVGYNPGFTPVTEFFAYSEMTGRLASKTTTFSFGPLPSVNERWHYNSLGLLAAYNHPRQSGLFSVATTYRSGLPVSVKANGIPVVTGATYHPSGIVASYTTGNGSGHSVTTNIGIDSTNWMPRPTSIATSGATSNLLEDPYEYDFLGNVVGIGSDDFSYDSRSRLMSATYGGLTRAYQYDSAGNMTQNGPLTYSVDGQTNRVRSDSTLRAFGYDGRGNLLSTGRESFTWDALDRMKTYQSGTSTWTFVYTGENERVLKVPTAGPFWGQYTLRDESKRVATEFTADGSNALWSRDDVYFGTLLVGSFHSCGASGGSGWEYTSSDHLGTPRLATDPSGTTIWQKKYWPYGETAFSSGQTSLQPLSYALMEQDAKLDGADLERFYDHARSHSSDFGRFLSPDLPGGKPEDPQSFNRYTYARNNPLKYVDPDGRKIEWFGSKEEIRIAKSAVGMARNAHPRLEKLVDGLERSSNVFRISLVADDAERQIYEADHKADDEVAASDGTGTGAMIWLFSPNDVPLSVFMEDAVHEMSHAEDSDTGTKSGKVLCKGCTSVTETKAVRMENLLSHRRDDPKTTYNQGRERVPNPTRVPTNPRRKHEEKPNRVAPSS